MLSPVPIAATGTSPDPRDVVNLDASWQFIRRDVPGAQAVDFDDSTWDTVTLPHTWNNLDGQDGGNNYYRGIGWYRQHYVVPYQLAGRELFLKFEGASLVTDLYVNGNLAGEHRGGFAAFVWDITPLLTVGADNVFAAKVDNTRVSDVAPLSGDFTIDGGIYRHVNLIATDPLHVSLTDYASPGVYLTQTNVSAASADVQITTKLQNDDFVDRNAMVQTTVFDAGGNAIITLESSLTAAAGKSRTPGGSWARRSGATSVACNGDQPIMARSIYPNRLRSSASVIGRVKAQPTNHRPRP